MLAEHPGESKGLIARLVCYKGTPSGYIGWFNIWRSRVLQLAYGADYYGGTVGAILILLHSYKLRGSGDHPERTFQQCQSTRSFYVT